MNRKQKKICMIPVLATVVAVMFAFAPATMQSALAEFGNMPPGMSHEAIEVDGFVGSVLVTEEEEDIRTLRDQITVSLSEASSEYADVMGGHVGFAVNENGEKYLVWTLMNIEHDSEFDTVTATMHIVDVADADNTATITREFDPSSMIHGIVGNDYDDDANDDVQSYPDDSEFVNGFGEYDGRFSHDDESGSSMMEMMQQRMSESTATSNYAESDDDANDARSVFVEILQELRKAMQDGDTDRASELREDLMNLRNDIGNDLSDRN